MKYLLNRETESANFTKETPCKWTNGYEFDTALMLSIFLGMFGVDRFYLGYPALGLLKFSTLGFFFLGHLLDIVLIASQYVGPADNSHYVISYFGAGMEIMQSDNETVRKPQADWF
jgi:TM2 domain-containing membrane protein YozV